jgi:hypothetical protein
MKIIFTFMNKENYWILLFIAIGFLFVFLGFYTWGNEEYWAQRLLCNCGTVYCLCPKGQYEWSVILNRFFIPFGLGMIILGFYSFYSEKRAAPIKPPQYGNNEIDEIRRLNQAIREKEEQKKRKGT